jgi:thioredoxin-like negative regulator of GroEL
MMRLPAQAGNYQDDFDAALELTLQQLDKHLGSTSARARERLARWIRERFNTNDGVVTQPLQYSTHIDIRSDELNLLMYGAFFDIHYLYIRYKRYKALEQARDSVSAITLDDQARRLKELKRRLKALEYLLTYTEHDSAHVITFDSTYNEVTGNLAAHIDTRIGRMHLPIRQRINHTGNAM